MEKQKEIRVKSHSQDAIYALTDGNVKPSKQLKLGLVIKKLTSSRNVVEIFNRYGHSASYNVETTTGKDTLHDRVGIAYQNIPSPPPSGPGTDELIKSILKKASNDFDFSLERKITNLKL